MVNWSSNNTKKTSALCRQSNSTEMVSSQLLIEVKVEVNALN